MKRSIVAFAVVASLSSFGVLAADKVSQDNVDILLTAEKSDLPTLTIGLGATPMKLMYDFSSDKFVTMQGLPLNIAMHNPNASADSFTLSVASYSANGHKLQGSTGDEAGYTFYLGSSVGSAGFPVAKATSVTDPFSGLTDAELDTQAKLTAAGLAAFAPVLAGVSTEQNISTTTTLSMESVAAPGISDDLYSDNAKLFVSGTWANYVTP